MPDDIASPKSSNSNNPISKLFFGTREKTYQESALVPSTQLKPYNPDDLWQRDNSYETYEEMLKDDQISQNVGMKKDLVIGSGFDIISLNEDHDEIRDDLYKALYDDVEFPFEEMLQDMLTAYEFGFSLGEKIFKKRPDGSLGLRKIKVTHPDSWIMHTDDLGNITRFEQQGIRSAQDIDGNTLIHFVNNRKFQNVYGSSDLRPAFQPWMTKRHITRFYAIFLEKFASPIPIAKYDSKTPRADVDAVFSIIKKFQQKTAMTIPKELEIEFLQAATNGGDAYAKGIALFNTLIARALFIPDLLGYSGDQTGGGSYSLGEKQLDLFLKHINRRRRQLEQIINAHIIRPLVLFNFGDVENHPEFRLNPITEDNTMEFARIWIEAQKLNKYKPTKEEINHLLAGLKFPENEEMELVESTGQSPLFPGTSFEEPEEESPNPPMAEEPEEEIEDETEDVEEMSNKEKKYKQDDSKKPSKLTGDFNYPEGEYYKKVDFQAAANQLDANQSLIVADFLPLLNESIDDLFEQAKKKKILEKRAPERIASIKLKNKRELQNILKRHFKDHFIKSKTLARKDLFTSTATFAEPLPSDMFLKFLENESFQYINDIEYLLVDKELATLLREGIKDGLNMATIINDHSGRMKEMGEVSIERYARTKSTEVFNKARVEFFEEGDVVVAYQYSALLDGRTTPICRGLDGKIFEKGKEPIPPMHFNCRSILIPITKFESYKPTLKIGNKSIDEFIDSNKGKGFAKR